MLYGKMLGRFALAILLSLTTSAGADLREDEIFDICDAPNAQTAPKAVRAFRGLARLVEGGILLQDGTCPVVNETPSNLVIPLLVKVVAPRFSRTSEFQLYRRLQDSFEKPLLQVVVTGNLSCKREFRVTTSTDGPMGNGYGNSGLVLCMIENGLVRRLVLVR